MGALKRVLATLTMTALLAFPFVIYFNAQALSDWWSLRGYSPPATVSSLASQDTMTDSARRIFYINHPDIQSSVTQFRKDCELSEKTIILGCYHGNQAGIFVYNVQDSRLAGVQQVTAAHEMLHAAYDRLSSKDKANVNELLQSYFDSGLKDQRIIDTINAYKESEPNDLINEMHSIFATEVANLPSPLENYYRRYFTNRHAITTFANNYQSEFTSREAQIKTDDARLLQMKNQINSRELSLQNQLIQINNDRARLDSEKASGQIAQYNSSVASFNREVDAYNSGVSSLRSEIDDYNQLVSERNSIASQLASLAQAIDTRLVPQSTR